jgi:galactokinase
MAMTDATVERRFREWFGDAPSLVVHSPGRVNLIGDHTDYHDGLVLPAAINLGTEVAASPRDDRQLRVVAVRFDESDEMSLDELRPKSGPGWSHYVYGCVAMLRSAGYAISGADLLIDGDLPIGGGLSSSASLELGVSVALTALVGLDIDRPALARLCQRVENEVIGVQSGIMDQLAVACGVLDHALMIDCRSTDIELVPIPPTVRLIIVDSGIPRTLAGSAYNERRTESASALAALHADAPGLAALRDVTPALLARHAQNLDETQLRRARHVVTENQRVRESAAALRHGDIDAFGRLMTASHVSLRDDYDVSLPELDLLVATALQTPGVLGARMTGAGFGGCVVVLARVERAADAAAHIPLEYMRLTGRSSTAYQCRPSKGTHVR